MASRRPRPSMPDMDGEDHFFRQRYYQSSTLIKSRLKHCMFFHCCLSFVMLAKFIPYVLYWFNVTILDEEELVVLQPYLWEWIWLLSPLVSIFCCDAIKKNELKSLNYYIYSIGIFGYLPLLYAIFIWFPDVWLYMSSEDPDKPNLNVVYWKVPVACKSCPCGHFFYNARRIAREFAIEADYLRRTARVRREKPNYYDALEYDKHIKKLKKRLSESRNDDEEDEYDIMDKKESKMRRKKQKKIEEDDEEDPMTKLTPEMMSHCSMILEHINSKIQLVTWKPKD